MTNEFFAVNILSLSTLVFVIQFYQTTTSLPLENKSATENYVNLTVTSIPHAAFHQEIDKGDEEAEQIALVAAPVEIISPRVVETDDLIKFDEKKDIGIEKNRFIHGDSSCYDDLDDEADDDSDDEVDDDKDKTNQRAKWKGVGAVNVILPLVLAGRQYRQAPKIWDEWGDWSECSVSCGAGKLTRWRHCTGGGCSRGEKEAQLKTWNHSADQEPKVWDHWGEWTSCSVTCGSGKYTRWRHCVTGGCASGEKEAQIKSCDLPDC